jgi:outer membrane murein-binding lipoprotein Lpp
MEPTLSEVLSAVRDLDAKVDALTSKFDKAAGQIDAVAAMAGPAIEQISSSPIMKMFGGRK